MVTGEGVRLLWRLGCCKARTLFTFSLVLLPNFFCRLTDLDAPYGIYEGAAGRRSALSLELSFSLSTL